MILVEIVRVLCLLGASVVLRLLYGDVYLVAYIIEGM